MTEIEFAKGMAYLGAGVSQTVSADQMEVYWDLLKHLPFDVFREAIKRSLLSLDKNFLPSVGVIHRHACDIQLRLRNLEHDARRRESKKDIPYAQIRDMLGSRKRLGGPGELHYGS